jgi:hypothetical protein
MDSKNPTLSIDQFTHNAPITFDSADGELRGTVKTLKRTATGFCIGVDTLEGSMRVFDINTNDNTCYLNVHGNHGTQYFARSAEDFVDLLHKFRQYNHPYMPFMQMEDIVIMEDVLDDETCNERGREFRLLVHDLRSKVNSYKEEQGSSYKYDATDDVSQEVWKRYDMYINDTYLGTRPEEATRNGDKISDREAAIQKFFDKTPSTLKRIENSVDIDDFKVFLIDWCNLEHTTADGYELNALHDDMHDTTYIHYPLKVRPITREDHENHIKTSHAGFSIADVHREKPGQKNTLLKYAPFNRQLLKENGHDILQRNGTYTTCTSAESNIITVLNTTDGNDENPFGADNRIVHVIRNV